MNEQEVLGEVQIESMNRVVVVGPLIAFEGRWTRSRYKHLPKDQNPFMKDVKLNKHLS